MKTTVVSVLGTQKDAHGGSGPSRWDTWRPTIDAVTPPLNASTSQLARPAFRRDLLARINLWSFRLPGLADRREDIEPNLDYELIRFSEKTGKHISFNKEARERFLAFALDPNNLWPGNFRDLNAMVVRMSTLADGGRISLSDGFNSPAASLSNVVLPAPFAPTTPVQVPSGNNAETPRKSGSVIPEYANVTCSNWRNRPIISFQEHLFSPSLSRFACLYK